MALISCPECEHSVSDKAFSCPSCGYPMNICTASGKMFSHRSICKRRKLPNGFGSIKHLSGKRSRPWAAYPPEFSLNGSPVLGPAIGYFRIYDEAYQALLLYNYTSDSIKESNFSLTALCTAIPPIPIVLFWLIISFELPLAYGSLQVIVRFQISVEQVQSYFGQAQPFFPFCAPTPFYIKFIQ